MSSSKQERFPEERTSDHSGTSTSAGFEQNENNSNGFPTTSALDTIHTDALNGHNINTSTTNMSENGVQVEDPSDPELQLHAPILAASENPGDRTDLVVVHGNNDVDPSPSEVLFPNDLAICQEADSTTPTHRRTNSDTNRKKRLCRFPGCTKVIKSQGHCQRHGAKAKRCKVEGCEKQAQGTHNGMCKRHWKAAHFPEQVAAKEEGTKRKASEEQPPAPIGESVYDTILPASIAYRPSSISAAAAEKNMSAAAKSDGSAAALAAIVKEPDTVTSNNTSDAGSNKLRTNISTNGTNVPSANSSTSIVSVMPLVTFLRDGALHKEFGWHRQAERRARGIFPCSSLTSQLEPWEKQLALVEILLLSGGTPHANYKDLAHAWGRERGFHQKLAATVCTRRGEVERKRRSDAGKKASTKIAPTTTRVGAESSVEALYHKRPRQDTNGVSREETTQLPPLQQQQQQQQQQQSMPLHPVPQPVIYDQNQQPAIFTAPMQPLHQLQPQAQAPLPLQQPQQPQQPSQILTNSDDMIQNNAIDNLTAGVAHTNEQIATPLHLPPPALPPPQPF